MARELKAKIQQLVVAAQQSPDAAAQWAPQDQGELQDLLEELQPYDIAVVLPELDEGQQLQLLTILPAPVAAETLEHLDHDHQYHLLDHLDKGIARAMLAAMSSDAVVDLIGAVHPRQADELLGRLPEQEVAHIRRLMQYPENSAGGRMTVDYVSVRLDWTAEQVIAHFRKVGAHVEFVAYFYVVDREGRLVGATSMREVLLANPYTPVSEIMYSKVVSVPSHADQEEAARLLSQYDFVAVPVVNGGGRMVGLITVDDIIDVIEEEATEDIQKLGGSEPLTKAYFATSIWMLVRKRVGWILTLFLAEAYTGTVLRHYEETLSQVVSLAFFIPLLIGTGGNTGSQVVTTLVRGLAVGEVRFKDMARVLFRELATGVIIGLAMGAATVIRAYSLGVGPELGPIVGITAAFIVIWASLIAAILPLVLHRLKVDPAVVSGPFITTFVDGTGLIMYFTIARLLLGLA